MAYFKMLSSHTSHWFSKDKPQIGRKGKLLGKQKCHLHAKHLKVHRLLLFSRIKGSTYGSVRPYQKEAHPVMQYAKGCLRWAMEIYGFKGVNSVGKTNELTGHS